MKVINTVAYACAIAILINCGLHIRDKRNSIIEKKVETAFNGDCKSEVISLRNYGGQYTASPYAAAREKFQDLKNQCERFKGIPEDRGIQKIMESYNKDSEQIEIPRCNCE